MITTNRNNPRTELKAQLAQMSIYKLAQQFKRTDKTYVTTRMVTTVIDPLSDQSILERIKATSENLPVVACAILIAAYKNLDERIAAIDMSKLVNVILGTDVTKDILNSPSSLTSLFYGPGVWELYSIDANNENDIPRHLLVNNVSLLGLSKPREFISVPMPGDIM